ncbi:hypothetical protein [Fusibacter bizertensis]
MSRLSATDALKIRKRFKRHTNYEEHMFDFMVMTNAYMNNLTKRIESNQDDEVDEEALEGVIVERENYLDDIQDLKTCIYYGLYLSFFSYIEMKSGKEDRNKTMYTYIDENYEWLIENNRIRTQHIYSKDAFLETFSFFNRIRNIIAHSNGYYDLENDEIRTKKKGKIVKWKEEIPTLIERYAGITMDDITFQIFIDEDFVKAFWCLFYDEY